MPDVASLAIVVDASTVDTATVKQDALTKSSKELEAQVGKTGDKWEAVYTGIARRSGETIEQVKARYESLNNVMAKQVATENAVAQATDGWGMANASATDKLKLLSGVSEGFNAELAKQIATLKAAGGVVEGAGVSMQSLGLNTQYARQHLMMLGKEVVTGDFSRMPRTFASLVSHSNLMALALHPVTLGLIAVGAAAGGLAFAATRAETLARELTGLATQLAATGRGSVISKDGLKDLLDEMQRLSGVTKDAASKTIAEFVRTRQIGGDLFKDLSLMARDFAATTGSTIPEAAKKLAAAFADPARGAVELDKALGNLTASQILHIQQMVAQNDKLGAQQVLFDAMKEATRGLADQGLTPLQQATNDLSNAWDKLMKSMGNSSAVAVAGNAFTGLVNALAWILNNSKQIETFASGAVFNLLRAATIVIDAAKRDNAASKASGVSGDITQGGRPVKAIEEENLKTQELIKSAIALGSAYSSVAGRLATQTTLRNTLTEALTKAIIADGASALSVKKLRDEIAGLDEAIAKGQKVAKDVTETGYGKLWKTANDELTRATRAHEEYGKSITEKITPAMASWIKLQNDPAFQRNSQAIKDAIEGIYRRADAQDKLLVLEKEDAAIQKAALAAAAAIQKARDAEIVTIAKGSEAVSTQAAAIQSHTAQLGLSKEAVLLLAAAETEKAIAVEEGIVSTLSARGADEWLIAAHVNRIAVLKQLMAAQQDAAKAEGGIEGLKRLNDSLKEQATLAEQAQRAMQQAAQAAAQAWVDAGSEIAESLTKAFGAGGAAVGGMVEAFAAAMAMQTKITAAYYAEHAALAKKDFADEKAYQDASAKLAKTYASQSAQNALTMYGSMAGAAASYFDKQSTAYKVLHAIEQTMFAARLVMQVAEIAGNAMVGASGVNASLIQQAADGALLMVKIALGIANQANGDPYSAPFRMAAMAGIMAGVAAIAGLSFSGGGGGGGGGRSMSEQAQATQGTGTVLGDATAKSNSLLAAIQELEKIDRIGLVYTHDMLIALQAIQSSIGNLAAGLYRMTGAVTGLGFDVQTSEGRGGIMGWLFGSSSSSITDAGLRINGTLQQLMAGQNMAQWVNVRTESTGFLGGLFGGNRTSDDRTTKPLPDQVTRGLSLIFSQIGDTLETAAHALGLWSENFRADMNQIVINLGDVSLYGLTGTALSDAINAVLSTASDELARTVFGPEFDKFIKVGEGYYQMIIRVAASNELVINTMATLGWTLNLTGMEAIEARAHLVELAGGIENFGKLMQDYYSKYYSPTEQRDNMGIQLATEFGDLGVAMPMTTAGMRALIESIGTATPAARALTMSLIELAPTFYDYVNSVIGLDGELHSLNDVMEQNLDYTQQLDLLLGRKTQRQIEVENRRAQAIDAANLAILNQIIIQEDLAIAMAAINQAAKSITDSFADARRSIEMTGMSNEQQYQYLQRESARYVELMNSSTSAEEVNRYAQLIRQNQTAAFSLLSPEEQNRLRQTFLDNLDEVERQAKLQLEKFAAQAKLVADSATLQYSAAVMMSTAVQTFASIMGIADGSTLGITKDPLAVDRGRPSWLKNSSDDFASSPASLSADIQRNAADKQEQAAQTNKETAQINKEAAQLNADAAQAQLLATQLIRRVQINIPKLGVSVEAGA